MELIPKRTKIPLKRGTWLHALQEALHKSWAGVPEWELDVGRHDKVPVTNWEDVHQALTEEFNRMFDEEKEFYGNLPDECEARFRAYLRKYKDDQDKYKPFILPNGQPAIEFTFEVPLTKFGLKEPFKGRIDFMVEDQEYGGVWIWDAKWIKKVPSPDDRMMSPQALLYPWALKLGGLSPRGFIYNYGRTKPPTPPDVLRRGTLSVKQRMDCDVHTYLRAIKDLHGPSAKHMAQTYYKEKIEALRAREKDYFRRERVPVERPAMLQAVREFIVTARQVENRETAHPPRTYDYRCSWDCEYHELCVAEFQGLDISGLIMNHYDEVDERYSEETYDFAGEV